METVILIIRVISLGFVLLLLINEEVDNQIKEDQAKLLGLV